MMRAPARRRRIAQLIRAKPVTSQGQLVKMLKASGYPATQATVSRDLEEIGAVKVRRGGKVAYSLPDDAPSAPAGDALRRILTESVVGLESSGNLLVVKTPPGHAQVVASAIDRGGIQGIAGTVGGDDTVMVVCKQGAPARGVERRLRALAQMVSSNGSNGER
jgi:transcriptional regulator of arginine metabolism